MPDWVLCMHLYHRDKLIRQNGTAVFVAHISRYFSVRKILIMNSLSECTEIFNVGFYSLYSSNPHLHHFFIIILLDDENPVELCEIHLKNPTIILTHFVEIIETNISCVYCVK